MWQVVNLSVDNFFEFFNAAPVQAGCFDKGLDVGIFGLQAAPVDVQRLLVDLVANHNNGRIPPKDWIILQPVFDPVFILSQTGIQHQQVQAAFGQEELVGGVHDFLPAKIPDIGFNFAFCYFRKYALL